MKKPLVPQVPGREAYLPRCHPIWPKSCCPDISAYLKRFCLRCYYLTEGSCTLKEGGCISQKSVLNLRPAQAYVNGTPGQAYLAIVLPFNPQLKGGFGLAWHRFSPYPALFSSKTIAYSSLSSQMDSLFEFAPIISSDESQLNT